MADPLTEFLKKRFPERRQGKVITVNEKSITVQIRGQTKTVRRTNALALKPGDRVNIAGDQVVGKRKPPPTGATYEV